MGLIKTLRNIRNGVISAIPLLPNYNQTQYVDDNLPALESKNLNKAEKQLVTLTNQINANIGTLNTLITNSNLNVDKVQKLNSNGDFNQDLSMNIKKIYNLAPPTNNLDAVNKSYSDSFSFRKQGYNAGGNKITNLGDGVNPTDGVNKQQLDAKATKWDYNAEGNKITNLGTPTNDTDGATKKYVDDNAGGGTTPVREVMYNETRAISQNNSFTFNMSATGNHNEFRNIEVVADSTVPNFSPRAVFLDPLSYTSNDIRILQINPTSSFNYVSLDVPLNGNTVRVYNNSGGSKNFTVKMTGERITTTKEKTKKKTTKKSINV